MCSADLRAHNKEVKKFIRKASPESTEVELEKMVTSLLKPDGKSGLCIQIPVLKRNFPKPETIVAYEFTTGAIIRAQIKVGFISTGTLLLWFIVILNLYYRVLMYIVYGRRPARPSSRT